MKKRYRKSQFNYETRSESGYFIYNTMYNSLVRLNEKEYLQYENLEFQDACLQDELYRLGILMEPEIDELEIYHKYTEFMVKHQEGGIHLTVTPTMECNARCFYCYESGVRHGRMKNLDVDKIIQWLSKMNVEKGLKLTWFGGEPLMNQEWMDYFSKALKDAGIEYSSFMITNGSKIQDGVIDKMINDWKISSVQISMDGEEEEYYRRKKYMEQDETLYFSLLKNIKKMSKRGISVQIRINVDSDNLESVCLLIDDLEYLFYKNENVTFYPSFLTGNKKRLSEDEKVKIILEILKRVKNPDKLPVGEYMYSYPKVQACFYYNKNAFSIDANGDIFICEHMLGRKELAIGNVNQEFDIKRNYRETSGKREECQKCVFLPKCQGGCYSTYVEGETPCFMEKYMIQAYLKLL